MNLVFGGISDEGVFAFFIIFCALAGMFIGAYLMDKDWRGWAIGLLSEVLRFMDMVRDFGYWFRANLRDLRFFFRHLPSAFPCLFNGHHYVQGSAVVDEERIILTIDKCTRCSHTGRIKMTSFDDIEKIKRKDTI